MVATTRTIIEIARRGLTVAALVERGLSFGIGDDGNEVEQRRENVVLTRRSIQQFADLEQVFDGDLAASGLGSCDVPLRERENDGQPAR